MTATTASAWPIPPARAAIGSTALLVLVGATVGLAAVSDGNVLITVAPLFAALALWALWVAPPRVILMSLIFLGLVLDKPSDDGPWASPLSPIGSLLLENLNKTVKFDALKLSLLIFLLIFLLAARGWKLLRGGPRVQLQTMPFPEPMKLAMGASLLMAIWLAVYGIALGGDPQMCKIQLQTFLALLGMAYLLGTGMRGVGDYKTLATIVIVAACFRAVEAIWVRNIVMPSMGIAQRSDDFATSHGDSMLFTCAAVILIASYLEAPVRRNFYRMAAFVPVIFMGMVANNRRLVWLQLITCLAMMAFMGAKRKATRRALRVLVCASPIILIYAAAGWNSSSRVFAPVAMLHSVSDSDTNRSTLYRDTENYNLIYTFDAHPILGSGLGHPFELPLVLDDISQGFREWRYLPHNSILGLWAFGGLFGFVGLWLSVVVALLLAARSYRLARSPDLRLAAIAAMAAIITYVIHCWGDIGFSEQRGILLVGPAIAVAGQLAVSTGAWRTRKILSTP